MENEIMYCEPIVLQSAKPCQLDTMFILLLRSYINKQKTRGVFISIKDFLG